MPTPDLAIIVTSFQMSWHLRRALESIAQQRTERRLEVVVSDDGSTDATPQVVAEFARQAPFPVQFVTHPHTQFHAARCRNEGVRHSTAPHLLFFDGDCLLPPDHVEQHLRAWRPQSVTCSYCVRLEEEVSRQVTLDAVRSGAFLSAATSEQRRKLRHMHLKALWYGLIAHPTKPSFRSTDFFMGRDDFVRVNGFDENFRGWGCEDDDFGRRLRVAGVRPTSVLHRTCVYHLWHPPAPTRPVEWKQGSNVAYLQRPIRLTRCLNGQFPRQPHDLTVRLCGDVAAPAALRQLLARHGWQVETAPKAYTDLELVCRPGNGRFTSRGDCRVLAVLDESLEAALAERFDARPAHVVLSPRGEIGRADQARLRLDDTLGFWALLQGRVLSPHRAAA